MSMPPTGWAVMRGSGSDPWTWQAYRMDDYNHIELREGHAHGYGTAVSCALDALNDLLGGRYAHR